MCKETYYSFLTFSSSAFSCLPTGVSKFWSSNSKARADGFPAAALNAKQMVATKTKTAVRILNSFMQSTLFSKIPLSYLSSTRPTPTPEPTRKSLPQNIRNPKRGESQGTLQFTGQKRKLCSSLSSFVWEAVNPREATRDANAVRWIVPEWLPEHAMVKITFSETTSTLTKMICVFGLPSFERHKF